jgi:hypothetical protein
VVAHQLRVTTTLVPTTRGGLLLRVVLVALALIVTSVLVLIATIRPAARTPGPGWVRGAALSTVRERGVLHVPLARAFLVATGPSRVLALYDRSPQMGEPIHYCPTSGWFEDPAHGSKFDGLGRYALGPAPRGMDRFAVEIVDGVDRYLRDLPRTASRRSHDGTRRCLLRSPGLGACGNPRA